LADQGVPVALNRLHRPRELMAALAVIEDDWGKQKVGLKPKTHFQFRLDLWDAAGEKHSGTRRRH
jgi:hypothetical protein